MADLSTIQDYSMIDSFLQDSLKNYNNQVFGNYDEKTGYYPTQKNEVVDELEQDAQLEDEQTESYATDPVNQMGQTEDESMYDYLFGDGSYQQSSQSNEEDDFFAPAATDENEGAWPGGITSLPTEDDRRKKPLKDQISDKESQGKYTATNPNSSATGKYQFLWSNWGDSIKTVTGVKDQKAFLNNPEAQEKYYTFYEKEYLLPQVEKIKRDIKTNLTTNQLAKLVHFRGETGARRYLKGEVKDKPESYNSSISNYIKQAGGVPIAKTRRQQNVGLNDSDIDSLILPLDGINTIRGLDSGEPVFIEDETGKRKVLRGPKQLARMKGRVFERKLK